MKKTFLALVMLGALVSASFAQVVDDPSKYTSGAPAPATPNVTINHVASSEPIFAISVHPVSLIFYPLFKDYLPLMLTLEGNINSNASIITRPYFKTKSWDGEDENRKKIDFDVNVFGISEGFRYYFNRGHLGMYTAIHAIYEYAKVERDYEDKRSKDVKETGNSLGLAMYVGNKTIWGHFTSSFDIGATYTNTYLSKKYRDDLEEVSSVGVDFDVNYTIGFTF
ncbi:MULTISPECIES: DUF3575 domain-containing protein [unclassified Fibrobacter]|uniref:DUF3575 domain-containing protein n=1 Tax=unclassified Fibrobacter TaxID=2634177 RepID=UPI0009233631|nr:MULTISPECIES: DUF3575 domain-containing protein [Fibrobacter]MCQ2099139.1 DUF3575 domain-containing protein [Fibrobacter sp.]MCL4101614.1 hypothetical protein [Fibrobacter succinogenes]OWV07698.1 hypothetical protein B7993_02355 [Fibrobacter sp. UWH3]OWV17381.1 hypothetical protein B7992_00465 [Fibrobacter sp. UWH1]SHK54371.1 hypothetical protein SAMN05720765_10390 [Fibrobacter sp. UWH6]